jgi:hypothetical protein
MEPGLTTTQSDQWRSEFTGTKMSFFSKISIFFLAVQDETALTPSLARVLMKCDVNTCTSEFGLFGAPLILRGGE